MPRANRHYMPGADETKLSEKILGDTTKTDRKTIGSVIKTPLK